MINDYAAYLLSIENIRKASEPFRERIEDAIKQAAEQCQVECSLFFWTSADNHSVTEARTVGNALRSEGFGVQDDTIDGVPYITVRWSRSGVI